jgi:hypothetical protein
MRIKAGKKNKLFMPKIIFPTNEGIGRQWRNGVPATQGELWKIAESELNGKEWEGMGRESL